MIFPRVATFLILGLFSQPVFADILDAVSFLNPKMPFENIVTGGQPSESDLTLLKEKGVTTVINLRPSYEFDKFDEASVVKSLGMSYASIPIASSKDISEENAVKLDNVLKETNGTVFVHCKSGNRVGALFSLRAFFVENQTAEQSLLLGKNAGLTSLEKRVKTVLSSHDPEESPY